MPHALFVGLTLGVVLDVEGVQSLLVVWLAVGSEWFVVAEVEVGVRAVSGGGVAPALDVDVLLGGVGGCRGAAGGSGRRASILRHETFHFLPEGAGNLGEADGVEVAEGDGWINGGIVELQLYFGVDGIGEVFVDVDVDLVADHCPGTAEENDPADLPQRIHVPLDVVETVAAHAVHKVARYLTHTHPA